MSGRIVVTDAAGELTEGGDWLGGGRARGRAGRPATRSGTGSRSSSPTAARCGCSTSAGSAGCGSTPTSTARPGRRADHAGGVPRAGRPRHGAGQGAAARPVGDRRGRQPARRRDAVAGADLDPRAPRRRSSSADDLTALHRALRRGHPGRHPAAAGCTPASSSPLRRPGRALPALRRRDERGTVGGRTTWWCPRGAGLNLDAGSARSRDGPAGERLVSEQPRDGPPPTRCRERAALPQPRPRPSFRERSAGPVQRSPWPCCWPPARRRPGRRPRARRPRRRARREHAVPRARRGRPDAGRASFRGAPQRQPPRPPRPRLRTAGQRRRHPGLPAPALTLTVGSTGGPVAGAFYEDLGRFAFSGTAAGLAGPAARCDRPSGGLRPVDRGGDGVGQRRTVERQAPRHRQGDGPVPRQRPGAGERGGGERGRRGDGPRRPVVLAKPVAKVDSLKNLAVSGSVLPARAGVSVHVDVRSGSRWKQVAVARTDAAGAFRSSLGYGKGRLAAYTLRATYRAVNTPRWEASAAQGFTRVAVLNPQVSETTSADVAKTYRKGCPVGPSKLRTVHHQLLRPGQADAPRRDHRPHRPDEQDRPRLHRALAHRYPVAKMKNPNEYGGNDPKQMAANNTSGFNCRKVVGNPYAQSPHSYGIAHRREHRAEPVPRLARASGGRATASPTSSGRRNGGGC